MILLFFLEEETETDKSWLTNLPLFPDNWRAMKVTSNRNCKEYP
jgi:hypothetical protein